MSDRAIPRSFRFMQGFGVHTFRMINAQGKSTFVKFIWKPKLGMQSVVWNEAVKINGADPDFHRRDLWNSIQSGDFPEWELCLQTFDEDFANKFDFDVLDPTKLIPEEILPARPVGRLVLDLMPDNFFAETEQVAFQTGNVVPGIAFSNDPLLQGRNFSYLDTQLKRLGSTNFNHLPINAPKCPFAHFQQDGHMAMHNPKGRANYEPNGWETAIAGPRESAKQGYKHFPEEADGPKLQIRAESFADHYSQARQFYISQHEIEQAHIADALVFELSKCEVPLIRERIVAHLLNIDKNLAAKVADGLGLAKLPKPAPAAVATRTDLKPSDALSILKNAPDTFKGRKIGVLVTDGFDAVLLDAIKKAAKAEGAVVEIIAPKISGAVDSNGNLVSVHHKIDGGPSVVFDAVVVLATEKGVAELAKLPPARDFVADAYAHYKFVAFTASAKALFKKAGLPDDLDEGFMMLKNKTSAAVFVQSCRALRFWDRPDAA
jgi:catalase